MSLKERATRIRELEKQIADLEARLPAHSVPPAMIEDLETLEEELERLKAEQQSIRVGQRRLVGGKQTR
jgi:polyhydroxyalkanoate synthesis regulator phasin